MKTPLRELRALIATHGSQLSVARELGVSAAYLNDILQGRRAAGPKVLKKLGLKRVTRYEVV